MADYLELYFGAPDDTETVLATLGELLGTSFAASDQPYGDYLAHDGPRHYDLELDHGESDDDSEADIPFTAMPYVLTLRGDRDRDEELRALGTDLIAKLGERNYVPARLLYATTEIVARID